MGLCFTYMGLCFTYIGLCFTYIKSQLKEQKPWETWTISGIFRTQCLRFSDDNNRQISQCLPWFRSF
jgi:hypothetical protein